MPRVPQPQQPARATLHCGHMWQSTSSHAGVATRRLLLRALQQPSFCFESMVQLGALPLERLDMPCVPEQELRCPQNLQHALVSASPRLDMPMLWSCELDCPSGVQGLRQGTAIGQMLGVLCSAIASDKSTEVMKTVAVMKEG